jgi:hypothetical protein
LLGKYSHGSDHDSSTGSNNRADAIPPEWMPREVAVDLVVKTYGADPEIVERAVTLAAIAGAIPVMPDFDAYRAADPAEHIFHIDDQDALSTYEFMPSEMDWAAFTGRVYHHGTTRSMIMAILLNRSALLRWVASWLLIRRSTSPASQSDSQVPLQSLRPAPTHPATHEARLAAANNWMAANVTKSDQWKSKAAIAHCMAETHCTRVLARLAWKALPNEVRGRQGRPPKHRVELNGANK